MKKLITQTEVSLKNMRWKTFWYDRKGNTDDEEATQSHRREITVDFKSTKTPPQTAAINQIAAIIQERNKLKHK